MVARTAGRKGRPWRRLRAQILSRDDTCWICGHGGAGELDHVVARSQGGAPQDRANLRPAHGSSARCPICGQACNQKRGTGQRRVRVLAEVSNLSRRW